MKVGNCVVAEESLAPSTEAGLKIAGLGGVKMFGDPVEPLIGESGLKMGKDVEEEDAEGDGDGDGEEEDDPREIDLLRGSMYARRMEGGTTT